MSHDIHSHASAQRFAKLILKSSRRNRRPFAISLVGSFPVIAIMKTGRPAAARTHLQDMIFDARHMPPGVAEPSQRTGNNNKSGPRTKRLGPITSGVAYKDGDKLIIQARPDQQLHAETKQMHRALPNKAKLAKVIKYFRFFSATVVWKNFQLEQLSPEDDGDLIDTQEAEITDQELAAVVDDHREDDEIIDRFGEVIPDADDDESDTETRYMSPADATEIFEYAVAKVKSLAEARKAALNGKFSRERVDGKVDDEVEKGLSGTQAKLKLKQMIDGLEFETLCRILEVEAITGTTTSTVEDVYGSLVEVAKKLDLIAGDDPEPNPTWVRKSMANADPATVAKMIKIVNDKWAESHDTAFLRTMIGLPAELPIRLYCKREASRLEELFGDAERETVLWFASVVHMIINESEADDEESGADGEEGEKAGGFSGDKIDALVSTLRGISLGDKLVTVANSHVEHSAAALERAATQARSDLKSWQTQAEMIEQMRLVGNVTKASIASLSKVRGAIADIAKHIDNFGGRDRFH